MNRIIVYENSSAYISGASEELFNDLILLGFSIKKELGLSSTPIQRTSEHMVYVGSIVGTISINNTQVIIKPKYLFDDDNLDHHITQLISRSIKTASGNINSILYLTKNNWLEDLNNLYEILAKYFYTTVVQALAKSKISIYEERTAKLNTIKGKVLVQKQLSSPITDEKTWCRYKKLTQSNVYNQLLYWAITFLASRLTNMELKRKLILLSKEFDGGTILLNQKTVQTLKTPQRYIEYKECIDIAKSLYLKNQNRKQNIGKGKNICGYILNMEKAFENIVCFYSRQAAKLSKINHIPQHSQKLATSFDNINSNYFVRPDDLLFLGNQKLIMDAKYKVIRKDDSIKNKPSREDFYQMISTCIAYNCHEAILIYPQNNEFEEDSWQVTNPINSKKITIKSNCIDLKSSDEDIVNKIYSVIKKTHFYQEIINE